MGTAFPLADPSISRQLPGSLSAVSEARASGDARTSTVLGAFDTATGRKPLGVAADAGVMQIQLRESRFGVGPGKMRESEDPTGREEALLKGQVWCGEDDLGE